MGEHVPGRESFKEKILQVLGVVALMGVGTVAPGSFLHEQLAINAFEA